MAINDYTDLQEAVRDNGGLLTMSMEELRDIHGAGKLGVNVRRAITEELHNHGLGHLPGELPNYQDRPVRIYQLSSPIAGIVSAVLKPSSAGDQLLLSVGEDESATKAERILDEIRDLLGEVD